MRRALATVAVLVLAAGAGAVRADSVPFIAGGVRAIELCIQDVCGKAFFAGLFQGRVGNNPNAIGIISVSANHQPLPPPGGNALVGNGRWQLITGLRVIAGSATGVLHAIDDKKFLVRIHMVLDGDGGDATFTGLLDHNYFPPHLDGTISQ